MNSIVTSPVLVPDLEQAHAMLNMLSNEPKSFTFQTFDEDEIRKEELAKTNKERKDRGEKELSDPYARKFQGALSQHAKTLNALNTDRVGVFVTVNRTDLKGRSASNITKVRALFVDFDTENSDRVERLQALSLPPSMIVESSKDKHHAYWILKSGEIGLELFSDFQHKLYGHFYSDGADEKPKDLPRIMRLAGFWHQKGRTPFLSKIVSVGNKYDASTLMEWVNNLPIHEDANQKKAVKKREFNPPKEIESPSLVYSPKEIRLLARGRWVAILEKLGYSVPSNPKEHSPCPVCGGVDRFRFDDQYGDGSFICSQGNGETAAGNGFALLSDHAQMGFDAALKAVASALNEMGYMSPFDDGHTKIENLESEIKRLAQMSEPAYALERVTQAKELKIQVTILDKLVNAERKSIAAEAKGLGMFADVQMFDGQVDGIELLEQIIALVNRHIVCDQQTSIATALWIMFTWCIEAMQIAPIACITAPEKRCGKTQLLTLIGELCYRPLQVANLTAASAFRSIDLWQPTLLVDEYDTFIKDNEDLRGIFNAGHSRKNAFVIRTTGEDHTPTQFNVWCAKVLSGIGKLPDTLKDRSIILELRRKLPNEARQRLRHTDPLEFEQVKQKLARWAHDNLEALKSAKPMLPNALNDRAQDNWEALFAIADLISEEWGKKARNTALLISGDDKASPSINEELLADIQEVFASGCDKVFSDELISRLCFDDEKRWATWNRGRPISPKQISDRLKDFDIQPRQIRIGAESRKGYRLIDFEEAFERYLPQVENV